LAEKPKQKELNLLSLPLPLLLVHHHSQTDLAASERNHIVSTIFSVSYIIGSQNILIIEVLLHI